MSETADDVSTEALLEFLNACEAGIAAAKQRIKEAKGVSRPEKEPKESWNPENILWIDAQGSKGPYQKSDDVNNTEFKAMLKDLQSHKGKLSRGGHFYWTFESGVTVGRKKRS